MKEQEERLVVVVVAAAVAAAAPAAEGSANLAGNLRVLLAKDWAPNGKETTWTTWTKECAEKALFDCHHKMEHVEEL